jgi:hypothetical protein
MRDTEMKLQKHSPLMTVCLGTINSELGPWLI